jgi:Cu2+-exporting ATPase
VDGSAAANARRRPARAVGEHDSRCFHCGTPNPIEPRWRAEIDGVQASFCCAGCLAVAQTIRAAGLAGFYLQRDRRSAPLQRGDDAGASTAEVALAHTLVAQADGSTCEAALLLDGLRCGACVWLIETWLAQQPGIRAASVNLATRRARVRYSADATNMAAILHAIARIGYRAFPYDPARREALVRSESRTLLRRTALALLGMMQVMMFAAPAYVSPDGVDGEYRMLLNWAALILTVPVVAYSAAPFFTGAWRDLARLRRPGMDVPIALGIAAAFAASAWATITGAGAVYFDSLTMFVALVLAARWLELRVREKAGDALEANARELPATAERLTGYPDATVANVVSGLQLVPGDVVRIAAGASVPVDGEIVEGRSSVEEAVLTGESWPRAKGQGDRVMAGSVNRDSPLIVRVDAVGEATTLGALARLVERAATERPRIARIADRYASLFVVVLLAIAGGSALAWWQVDPTRALPIAIAVLVASCPCALSLATPAALASAAGALGRRRVLFVRTDALETLSRVTHVVFDKTGTLTTGDVRLLGIDALASLDIDRCLSIAAALERGSGHPIARALEVDGRGASCARDVVAVPGCGVEGTIDGERYRFGRPDWVAGILRAQAPSADVEAGVTVVALANDKQWLANLRFGDSIRADAPALVATLQKLGLHVSILSGDCAAAVAHVAGAIGVADWRADAAPDFKRASIAALQEQGAVVAMIGDGVNDAPSLARADVSMALGNAAALTQWTADVVVLGDHLARVAYAFSAARRTFRVIRQNLGWALVYNAIAIPFAAAGYLSPLAAAAGMSASSLLVVGNAWRLSRLAPADADETAFATAAPLAAGAPATR